MKENTYTPKKCLLKMLIIGLVLSAVHIALERLMSWAGSDIALRGLVGPLNWGLILCDAALLFACYGLMIFAIYRFGTTESLSLILMTFAITLIKHLGNWFVFLWTENVTSALNIRLSATTAASGIAIEFLQHAVILTVVLLQLRAKPSVKRAVLGTCITMVLFNVVSRIIGDIEYGAPSSAAETWIMVLYYALDIILYGVIGYFCLSLLCRNARAEAGK